VTLTHKIRIHTHCGRKRWRGQELTASDAGDGDRLGFSVSMAGATIMNGAFHVERQTGAAYRCLAGRQPTSVGVCRAVGCPAG
jgi:hypothetical protein